MLRLPHGYEFIPDAPFSLETESSAPEVVAFQKPLPGPFNPPAGQTRIPFTTRSGTAIVTIKAKLFYCDKVSKMCFQNTRETRLTLEVDPQGSSTIFFIWEISPK